MKLLRLLPDTCHGGNVTANAIKPGRFRRTRWEMRCSRCGIAWTLPAGTSATYAAALVRAIAFYGHDEAGDPLEH